MIARTVVALLAAVAMQTAAAQSPAPQREPWEEPYTGQDAGGNHVMGFWSFDGDDPASDQSVHKHRARFEGATIVEGGRFGKCLRSFPGWPVDDKRHQMVVPNHVSLSLKGAFTLELWIQPDEAFKGYPDAFLIDKKYVADTDYQLIMGRPNSSGRRMLRAVLGFGTDSDSWYSEPVNIDVGSWYHIAFVYDGKGTGSFFVNGRLRGRRTAAGRQSIRAGSHFLSIGDRIGSNYHGFPGRIDQVRISQGALEFRRARLEQVSDRTCFRRFEKGAKLQFRLTNLQRAGIDQATLTWTLNSVAGKPQRVENIAAGKSWQVTYELDTSLRPDTYDLRLQLDFGGEPRLQMRDRVQFQIVARQPPHQFPVVMWGAGPTEIDRLKEIGFTHALGIGADYEKIWQAGGPTAAADAQRVASTREKLDRALSRGISFAASLSPGSYLRDNAKYLRVDREGKPLTSRPNICGLFPEIGKFCFNVGASVARTYGDLPAFEAALLHTEVRDAAQPCFHAHDIAALRRTTGIELPDEVRSRWGVDYKRLAGFPADRVVDDKNPIYVYYRWYWKYGDGWNHLNSELHRGLDTVKRDRFWTWHDPAVRVASVFGSGGTVDFISQWTYSYPDPIRIGVATDELLAMARGSGGNQQVMKMTQIIWYRSQTAPEPKKSKERPEFTALWEHEQPDAPFITIAPMHLREAFWTKIARPIKGIMYHGWQSLVPVDPPSGYRYTHPQTQYELARLIRTVIRPLGPTLRQVEGVTSDVAFYESFASQVFAGRGTYGWGGKWLGDAYHVAMWAGLQPDIVFDETITSRGLSSYKVLFMADCDVLTRSVVKKILEFQRGGGLVVGDDHTCPAITPDILLTPHKRTGRADKDKAELQKIAQGLRTQLDGRYVRHVNSSNPDVIPYRRRSGSTDYLFLVNDHREYGHYVGHHGRVMENGLPSRTTVSIARNQGFFYDLVEGHRVDASKQDGHLTADLTLGPCDGKLLMITSRPIQGVKITCPGEIARGEKARVLVHVVDDTGSPIDAVVPIQVTIEDSQGRLAEFSGFWAAVKGVATIDVDVARNDPPGTWTIRAKELASGRSTNHYLRVLGDAGSSGFEPLDKEAANPVQPDG